MAKPEKLPSGNWRVQVYLGTDPITGKKQKKSFTAPTKKEAELIAAQYAAKAKEPASQMTVGRAIDKYIESKSNLLSPTTLNSYIGIKRNYFQTLMDLPLSRVTRQSIQLAVNSEAARVSPKTVANAFGLLRSVLKVYAPDLSCAVTLPKKKKVIRSMPEPKTIIDLVKGSEIELPVLLAIWLSLRMSEVRGLKVSDINDGKMLIHCSIVTVKGKHIEKDYGKTFDSTRVENVPPYIQSLVDQLPADQVHLTELTGQQIYKRFIKLQHDAGIEHPIRFHDLRHLNASVMVKLGIPDKYAMERGGWSTPNTLRNVYQHTFSKEREAVNKKIDEYFESLIS